VCGIVGICDPDSPPEVTSARIQAMADSVRHRGPDGEGYFSDGGVALGMRRLAVIDLVTGDQPVFDEDRSAAVVFNGEIYNYRELRTELAAAGRHFVTQSDTEVIVQGYAHWGEGVFARLNGMFAVALLDRRNRRLVLARDHAGIKPLYYAWDGRRLAFGSEIKAVLASELVARDLDFEALAEFLAWEYVPCPRTLFRGIRKLPPASCWTLDLATGTARETRFWRLPDVDERPASDEDWVDRLDQTLLAAVRRQMVSDVPLGAFLSGGVDSSLVVAAMGRAQTFSIGFEDGSYNELGHSRRVAEHLGCAHVTELVREDSLRLFPDLMEMLDDPISDTSMLPTYHLSRLARRHVTVSLSGDGGDELFGGYETYRARELEARYRRLPAILRSRLVEPAVRRLRPRAAKKGLVNRAIRFVEGLGRPASVGHARWRMYLDAHEARSLLTEEAAHAALPALEHGLADHLAGLRTSTALDGALRADYSSFLLDDILVKLDRSSMAVSLEARVPYLDREVVELAFRMPAALKIRGGTSKWVLKQVAARRLPRETVRRPKEGFSAPVKQWLGGHGRPLMEELLDENALAEEGIFRPEVVRALKREHLGGQRNHAHLLWSLMVFQGWKGRWLERVPAAGARASAR
jgi:asparagine synthase (glutamine-hydrolysing)